MIHVNELILLLSVTGRRGPLIVFWLVKGALTVCWLVEGGGNCVFVSIGALTVCLLVEGGNDCV